MKRTIIALAVLLPACGDATPEKLLQIHADTPATKNACLYTWAGVRDAWTETGLPLDTECVQLDSEVTIKVTKPASMPCPDADGCTVGATMYLRSTLTDDQSVSAATHEWIHVLRACQYGSGDAKCTDKRLWTATDPDGVEGDTVEAIAVRNAPHGHCLEKSHGVVVGI